MYTTFDLFGAANDQHKRNSSIFDIIYPLLVPKTICLPKRRGPDANRVSAPTRCQEETQNPAKRGYQSAAINGLHSLTDLGAEGIFQISTARCAFPHFHVLKIKDKDHVPVLTRPFLHPLLCHVSPFLA